MPDISTSQMTPEQQEAYKKDPAAYWRALGVDWGKDSLSEAAAFMAKFVDGKIRIDPIAHREFYGPSFFDLVKQVAAPPLVHWSSAQDPTDWSPDNGDAALYAAAPPEETPSLRVLNRAYTYDDRTGEKVFISAQKYLAKAMDHLIETEERLILMQAEAARPYAGNERQYRSKPAVYGYDWSFCACSICERRRTGIDLNVDMMVNDERRANTPRKLEPRLDIDGNILPERKEKPAQYNWQRERIDRPAVGR